MAQNPQGWVQYCVRRKMRFRLFQVPAEIDAIQFSYRFTVMIGTHLNRSEMIFPNSYAGPETGSFIRVIFSLYVRRFTFEWGVLCRNDGMCNIFEIVRVAKIRPIWNRMTFSRFEHSTRSIAQSYIITAIWSYNRIMCIHCIDSYYFSDDTCSFRFI